MKKKLCLLCLLSIGFYQFVNSQDLAFQLITKNSNNNTLKTLTFGMNDYTGINGCLTKGTSFQLNNQRIFDMRRDDFTKNVSSPIDHSICSSYSYQNGCNPKLFINEIQLEKNINNSLILTTYDKTGNGIGKELLYWGLFGFATGALTSLNDQKNTASNLLLWTSVGIGIGVIWNLATN